MKVFLVGSQYGYGQLFVKYGHALVQSVEMADVLLFTGGEDVSPSYYGQTPHPRTYYNKARDVVEKEVFNVAVQTDKPCVGICRGGQFLNVMSGGEMYQDVSNHTRDHYIKDAETGMLVFASSTHHQMMKPGPGGVVLATANENGYKEFMKDGEIVREVEESDDVEAVYYPVTRSLCFQPHPEFPGMEELQEYFFHLINKHLI